MGPVLWVGWLAALATSSAHATEASRVRVEPPLDECISESELGARVVQALEPRSSSKAPGKSTLLVRVTKRVPRGWSAEVSLEPADPSVAGRKIETWHPSCRDLDDALVLVSAALLESEQAEPAESRPDAAIAEAGPSGSGDDVVSAAPEGPSAARPDADVGLAPRTATASPRRQSALFAGGAALLGVLSDPVASVRLDSRFPASPRFALRIGGGLSVLAPASRLDGALIDYRVVTGRVLGCAVATPGARAYVDACVGADAGVLTTRGTHVRGQPNTTEPLLFPLAQVASGMSGGKSWLVELHLAGGPAVWRKQLFLRNVSGEPRLVRNPAIFIGEFGVSLGLRLP